MSDLKAAFRAAKEQRSSTVPTPAQIRAMKAAKLSQKQGVPGASTQQAGSTKPSSGPARPSAASTKASAAPGGLPADFFQASTAMPVPVHQALPTLTPTPAPAPSRPAVPTPAPSAAGRGSGSTLPVAPVPEGFFSNKVEDAKARGVKLLDARDREDEFQAFQRAIEQDMQQAAEEEAKEAAEAGAVREDMEDFEQWVRLQRVEEMRRKRQRSGLGGSEDPDAGTTDGQAPAPPAEALADAATVTAEMLGLPAGPAIQGIQLPKRRRLAETLQALEAVSSGSSSEGEGDDDPVLNWRAKKM